MTVETYLYVTKRDRKLTCVNGHERTPENVSAAGQCRICKRERYHINPPHVRIYVKSITGRSGNQTHCKRGHIRTEENVYSNGTCRPCSILHSILQKLAVATTEPDAPFEIAPQAALEPLQEPTVMHSDDCDSFNPEIMCGDCREILEACHA